MAPTFARFIKDGAHVHAASVIPSFTNPNNLSIVTGRPPSVHGICRQLFLRSRNRRRDHDERSEMAASAHRLRSLPESGAKVAVVTAKDKLRVLLGKGLASTARRRFSSEKADKATQAENGIDECSRLVGMDVPEVYSAELSEFVFAAGVKLLQARPARSDVSLDHRLCAAQICAGLGGRQRILRHDR